ncbi:MAG: hypothetical protein H5T86_12955, partial [Armatimonadetes bacterium]|nr:hypothetical protein [Armatimonadota bacterium]
MLASAIVLLAVCGQSAAAPVDVCHNGYLILRLRVPAWGMTPEQRAVIVTQRFTSLVSDALERQAQERPVPWPTARYLRGQWVVEAR